MLNDNIISNLICLLVDYDIVKNIETVHDIYAEKLKQNEVPIK